MKKNLINLLAFMMVAFLNQSSAAQSENNEQDQNEDQEQGSDYGDESVIPEEGAESESETVLSDKDFRKLIHVMQKYVQDLNGEQISQLSKVAGENISILDQGLKNLLKKQFNDKKTFSDKQLQEARKTLKFLIHKALVNKQMNGDKTSSHPDSIANEDTSEAVKGTSSAIMMDKIIQFIDNLDTKKISKDRAALMVMSELDEFRDLQLSTEQLQVITDALEEKYGKKSNKSPSFLENSKDIASKGASYLAGLGRSAISRVAELSKFPKKNENTNKEDSTPDSDSSDAQKINMQKNLAQEAADKARARATESQPDKSDEELFKHLINYVNSLDVNDKTYDEVAEEVLNESSKYGDINLSKRQVQAIYQEIAHKMNNKDETGGQEASLDESQINGENEPHIQKKKSRFFDSVKAPFRKLQNKIQRLRKKSPTDMNDSEVKEFMDTLVSKNKNRLGSVRSKLGNICHNNPNVYQNLFDMYMLNRELPSKALVELTLICPNVLVGKEEGASTLKNLENNYTPLINEITSAAAKSKYSGKRGWIRNKLATRSLEKKIMAISQRMDKIIKDDRDIKPENLLKELMDIKYNINEARALIQKNKNLAKEGVMLEVVNQKYDNDLLNKVALVLNKAYEADSSSSSSSQE